MVKGNESNLVVYFEKKALAFSTFSSTPVCPFATAANAKMGCKCKVEKKEGIIKCEKR